MNSNVNEVASFYYQTIGNQTIPFDDFVRSNRPFLRKMARYEFVEWSKAIEQNIDLVDALWWLNINFGVPYRIENVSSMRSRYELLNCWEESWGVLPKHFRVAFIRSPKMKNLDFVDIDILKGLFSQHKKFDSVFEHLLRFILTDEDIEVDFSDYIRYVFEQTAPGELISEAIPWESYPEYAIPEESLITLSNEVGIDINWNPDELDSETLLYGMSDPDELEAEELIFRSIVLSDHDEF